MKLSKYEQETIIHYNEEEKTASVYTMNTSLTNKLAKLAEEYPDECMRTVTQQDGEGVTYIVPKKWVKVRPPRKMSEEQRIAASERLAKVRQNKDGGVE